MPDLETEGPSSLGPEATTGTAGRGPQDRFGLRWWISLLTVVGSCAFVFKELQPSQLFLNTTPTGGDMGAHVWLPAYLRDHLLPEGRITGWSPDYYAGFPALTFYFPLPAIMVVLLGTVVHYNIAFKLVSASGLVALPAAAWAFGRLARFPFPGPPCLAAAAVTYLFSTEYSIYGGNVASAMAGEYSFSIGLAFALVFLGLVARGLETGRNRSLAAVLLACTFLSHVLPGLFAVGGTLVLTGMRAKRRTVLTWGLPVLVTGGMLTAFWSLAFVFRLPYTTDMGYTPLDHHLATLLPPKLLWLYLLALLGAGLSLARGLRFGIFLMILTLCAGLSFCVDPPGHLWNARILPFWFLGLYLLAGVAFSEGGAALSQAGAGTFRRLSGRLDLTISVPAVTLAVALIWSGLPLGNLPFESSTGTRGDWMELTAARSYIPSWVHWNYSGYQSPDKSRGREYFALVSAMSRIGLADGCGRAEWEYQPSLGAMGTPDALMLLPYWTHSCIGSMEGLYYESSATTPYHLLDQSELSAQPSDPEVGLEYDTGPAAPDVAEGVQHMQMLGVRYFLAISPQVQAKADRDPSLRLIDTVGPFDRPLAASRRRVFSGYTWKIYRVLQAPVVTALTNRPDVVRGISASATTWLTAAQQWWLEPSRWKVELSGSGPASWTRVPRGRALPVHKLPPVSVSRTSIGADTISFHVDRIGVPVLVKASYFPNWKVSGGSGPWRVAPNLMVVVPTSHDVRLSYGYTDLDIAGYVVTAVGALVAAAMTWFAWRRRDHRRAGTSSPTA